MNILLPFNPHTSFTNWPRVCVLARVSCRTLFSDHVSLIFFNLKQCLEVFLAFMTLTLLMTTGQLFRRMSFILAVWYFSMITFRLYIFGRNITNVMLCSPFTLSSAVQFCVVPFGNVPLDYLVKSLSAKFLYWSYSLFLCEVALRQYPICE